MKITPEQLRIYAVTDKRWLKPGETLEQVVRELLEAGVTCVQYREKEAGDGQLLEEAGRLCALCRTYGVPLIINDRPDIAKAVGAAGVHVGQKDMDIRKAREFLGDGFIIGGSAHSAREAAAAWKEGADYLGCGAVFASSTKEDAVSLPLESLCEICGSVPIPVVAIGGITRENSSRLRGLGIAGTALISALFGAEDKADAVRYFQGLTADARPNPLEPAPPSVLPAVLTIAGSDPSGGAGIQADIKTMTALGVYAMSAVTALTAQNTTGVYGILDTPPEFLEEELDRVFEDIFPDAVKIGMLPRAAHIRAAARRLRRWGARHIVLDPVMASTSGRPLLDPEAVKTLEEELFPLAQLVTPNLPELAALTGRVLRREEDIEKAAAILEARWGCAVLAKGGHKAGAPDDYLLERGKGLWLLGTRISNPNTHGTGCTLSSAIASGLAKGQSLETAVRNGKIYLTGALAANLNLGRGLGPLNHLYNMEKEYERKS